MGGGICGWDMHDKGAYMVGGMHCGGREPLKRAVYILLECILLKYKINI